MTFDRGTGSRLWTAAKAATSFALHLAKGILAPKFVALASGFALSSKEQPAGLPCRPLNHHTWYRDTVDFLAQILDHKLLGPNASLSVGQSYKDFYVIED